MEKAIVAFKRIISQTLPGCEVNVDEPDRADGNYWIDVTFGKKGHTLAFRPGRGFGVFHKDALYGENPAEIYRTPERAAQRLAQIMGPRGGKSMGLGLKDIRQLYGHSQVTLAKKAGVKQPAISRFEKRGEVKMSTLASTIRALGGRLEIRAHFSDADVPISLSTSKGRGLRDFQYRERFRV